MKRYGVVAALFVLSMITYIDRACISTAKDPIARDLGFSDAQMGLVFSAFALGYALAQIPSGWLADRIGPRLALAAVVAGWSALTALTGAAWSLTSMVVIRFLFGVGEAGAFPGSARAFVNWLPVGERGMANGVLFSGSRIGAALAFPMLVAMVERWGWRGSFVVLGVLGVGWAGMWLWWFRDHPETRLVVTPPAAGQVIGLREVFRTTAFVPAMVQYFAGNFTFFICLSWMHPYLKRQYGLTDAETAGYAMTPLLVGAVSQWTAGWVVDRLYASRWRAWSRRLPAMAGFAMAAGGVLAVSEMETPLGAAMAFTAATFGADLTISPSWSYCADVAGKSAGSVSAAMNMIGNLGAFLSANAFPWLLGLTGSARAYFVVAAFLNGIAVLCWVGMKSTRAPATVD
ncbi:MAG TPA: MFS transporter [Bryobacteraceae bacterium]|nr:MFS transporter [Bryobacterales bacterium]HRJ17519.1 MFS transporter [Bryobacteraceae bacterium]